MQKMIDTSHVSHNDILVNKAPYLTLVLLRLIRIGAEKFNSIII